MQVWDETVRVERNSERRGDPVWLAERWQEPTARLLEVDPRGQVDADGDALNWRPCEGKAPAAEDCFLGLVDGEPRFARPVAAERDGGLRQLGMTLPFDQVELAFTAVAITQWGRMERFCPRCGGETDLLPGGFARRCRGCDRELFPRHDPAMIVSVTDDEDRLLLAHQRSWAKGRYSVLAGFLEAGESLEQCVAREIHEEVGLQVRDIRYVASQSWPFPRSLMFACTARAASVEIECDGTEIETADFFTREQVAEMAANGDVAANTASVSAYLIRTWLEQSPTDR